MSASKKSYSGHNNQGRSGNDNRKVVDCDAPYNFVPANRAVFRAPWAQHVSQDRPFADGVSGTIDYQLIAESRLLVGAQRDEAKGVEFTRLPDGRPFIPGSSIKGMLRNVVEIASFSRMRFVDDRRYSLRDLTKKMRAVYGDKLSRKTGDGAFEPLSQAGWLSFDVGQRAWTIQPCQFARIEHSDLAQIAKRPPWKNKDRPTARQKYSAWKKLGASLELTCDVSPATNHPHSEGKTLRYSKVDPRGKGDKGTLVFTGQPGPNKHMEFLFHSPSESRLTVDAGVWRGFTEVHADSDDWAYWKSRNPIPVFYLTDQNGSVESLGLAMMYKLAYTHTVRQTLAHSSLDHLEDAADDLAALLFGWTDDSGQQSLRSRVVCEPAKLVGDVPKPEDHTVILNSPKASFFPNYLRQPDGVNGKLGKNGRYITYMDSTAELRGWKRYPARDTKGTALRSPGRGQEKVASRLRPLPAGVAFNGRISFHNLRPAELGALVWALKLGGGNGLRHSLGMGKPYGMGQVRVDIDEAAADLITNRPGDKPDALAAYSKAFEDCMQAWHGAHVGSEWRSSPQVSALLAMANPANESEWPGGLEYIGANAGGNLMPKQHMDARASESVLPEYPGTSAIGTACVPATASQVAGSPSVGRHPWVAKRLGELAKPPDSINDPTAALRSKKLCESWQAIDKPDLKQAVLESLIAELKQVPPGQDESWWDARPKNKKQRVAWDIYHEAAGESPDG